MKTIDARGLSCPQPIVLLKKAVEADPSGAILLCDEPAARENALRFAANFGFDSSVADGENGEFTVTLTKRNG